MTNKDILPLFNEQHKPIPDEPLEFKTGWLNPAKFKQLMDSGPIPIGPDGVNAYKVFNSKTQAFNENDMFDDFWLDSRDYGPDFDARITVLKSFEMNRKYWWLKMPGSDGQPLYNISLYQWSKQNLAPETWQVWTKWSDEQQREKDTSSLSDFDF